MQKARKNQSKLVSENLTTVNSDYKKGYWADPVRQDGAPAWCFAASLILTFLFVFSCSSFQIKDGSNKWEECKEWTDSEVWSQCMVS